MRIAIKVSDFIAEVRRIVRDVNANSQIHSDETICRAVVDAFRHLHSVRPESRYNAQSVLENVSFPSDAGELAAFVVEVNEVWRLGIVYYAAARCYEADVTDSVNLQLSQALFQKADIEFQR